MKILQLLLSAVLVYALAISICCAAEHESGLKGQIVFQSDRDGNVEVFRTNADGSNPVQITHTELGDENEPVGNYCPAYSPDGTKIVFNRRGKGSADTLFVVDADGNNLTCLTSRDAYHSGVDYSPDGRHIAYKSNWDGFWNIYVMDADGSNIVQITHETGEDLNTRGGWKQ